MPKNPDYTREKYLPYNSFFQVHFKMTRNEWIRKYCPELLDEKILKEKLRKKHLQKFIEEYQRIKAVSSYDYEQKREKWGTPQLHILLKENNLSTWEELLWYCNLPKYEREKKKMNLKFTLIII